MKPVVIHSQPTMLCKGRNVCREAEGFSRPDGATFEEFTCTPGKLGGNDVCKGMKGNVPTAKLTCGDKTFRSDGACVGWEAKVEGLQSLQCLNTGCSQWKTPLTNSTDVVCLTTEYTACNAGNDCTCKRANFRDVKTLRCEAEGKGRGSCWGMKPVVIHSQPTMLCKGLETCKEAEGITRQGARFELFSCKVLF